MRGEGGEVKGCGCGRKLGWQIKSVYCTMCCYNKFDSVCACVDSVCVCVCVCVRIVCVRVLIGCVSW